jgi:stage V sporulation protein AD
VREALVIGTGAMMSPDSIKQGQAIPAVAHLVHLRHGEGQRGGER